MSTDHHTAWNWNVVGLLGRRRKTLSCDNTLRTSITRHTNCLLDRLSRHERHESRHHQLFRTLRLSEKRPRRAERARNLGHCGNLLRNDRKLHAKGLQHVQLVHHLRHKERRESAPLGRRIPAPRRAAATPPASPAAQPTRLAASPVEEPSVAVARGATGAPPPH